ncbi:MAG: protocatechuate 3,4-dioxygenase subunit alpha [Acidobacteria bacterium]|nr:protocatechuate 3,4-dioxygenase subunit alpha [Acidobacteriota bacterium]
MTGTAADRSIATPSQTVGPFFEVWLRSHHALGVLAGPETRGERLRLRVVVVDGDGAVVPDCLIEIYQADHDGEYGRESFSGFGRLPTGADGACEFETIRPGAVRSAAGIVQAPHVNVCLFARGLLRHLYTRVYFPDDPHLDADPILALVPPDRKHTLIAAPVGEGASVPRTFERVIRLQGDDETVFFDL